MVGHHPGMMRSCITIHQNEVRTNGSSVRAHNGIWYLVSIALSRQSPFPDDVDVREAAVRDVRLDKNCPSPKPVVFSHTTVTDALIPFPPYLPATVLKIQIKFGLFRKQNVVQPSTSKPNMLVGKLKATTSMLWGQWWPYNWSELLN